MALVKCKECGEKVSTKARHCVRCGARPPRKTSFLTWTVTVLIVVFVARGFLPSPGIAPEQAHAVPAENSAVINVKQIAGKTEEAVSNVVGQPKSCEMTKYGNKCWYEKGELEVVFIDGLADWITVEGIDDIAFSPSALAAIGLDDARPSFSNDSMLRWEPIQGLNSVSIFKGESHSSYAYIKVKTE